MRPSSIVFLNDFCIRYIQSEIESLVTHGASECAGYYNSPTITGWGAGYENLCIHSGINSGLTTDTVWYNYSLASSGTIINKDTSSSKSAINTKTTTESICPKGWSLPFRKELDRVGSNGLNPTLGGLYSNGALYNESTHGYWWGSDAYNGARRYFLSYYGDSLYPSAEYRHYGFYIRCVSEEKTVTDLTYMQDMTPLQFTGFFICLE